MSDKKQVREIVSDTETTGLSVADGNRIIEIGLIEVIDGEPTGKEYHAYINPEGQEIEAGAYETHKISADMLTNMPTFDEIADEVYSFLKGGVFVAHNATFDAKFLDMELQRAGKGPLEDVVDGVVDTMKIAKQVNPGKKKSLDALAKLYDVNTEERKDRHGALIDAEILVHVYKELKKHLNVDVPDYEADIQRPPIQRIDLKGFKPATISVSPEDTKLHEQLLDGLENPVERKQVKPEQVKTPTANPAKKSFF